MKTTVKVHYKGSKGLDSFSTAINLSKDDAIQYYLNKTWNAGSGEFDYFVKCYKVEILGPATDLSKYTRNDGYLYMLLSRLKEDCEYYLGCGNRNKKYLWALDETDHINEMKAIHDYLEIKPEWLTMEEITEFEQQFNNYDYGKKEVICVCEIYDGGLSYITKTKIEYKHTGVFYFYKKRGVEHILSGIDSAVEKKSAGKYIYKSSGHYIIDRVAIPTITAGGEKDWWYLNDTGVYAIKRASKYAKKIYKELAKELISVF